MAGPGRWLKSLPVLKFNDKLSLLRFERTLQESPGAILSMSSFAFFFFLSLVSYKVVFVFLSTHFIFFNPVLSNSGF